MFKYNLAEERETKNLNMANKLRQSEFSFDGEKYFKGFTLGERWNGFECPYFELETANQILSYIDETESLSEFPMVAIEDRELYPVGAFGWVWEEKE